MARLTTTDLLMLKQAPVEVSGARVARRRRISPQAGRALELLGHAIDYLTDEYVHEGGTFATEDAQWQAIQLLMSVNRQIYFECPEVTSLTDRLLALLHRAGVIGHSADRHARARSSRAA